MQHPFPHIFTGGRILWEGEVSAVTKPANTVFLYGEPWDYANYRLALEAVRLRPVVSRSLMAALACGGLLLPGGGDIHGRLPPEEAFLLCAFWEAHRPILGICRGMQALNVFRGGTLRDDLPGHQIPEGDMVHPSRAEGPLAALLGAWPTVTSSHHQAVDRVGEGLRLCQWAPDGTAEALYAPNRPVLGVQWHPERQSFANRRRDADDGAPVFQWLRDTLTNGGSTLYNEA